VDLVIAVQVEAESLLRDAVDIDDARLVLGQGSKPTECGDAPVSILKTVCRPHSVSVGTAQRLALHGDRVSAGTSPDRRSLLMPTAFPRERLWIVNCRSVARGCRMRPDFPVAGPLDNSTAVGCMVNQSVDKPKG
jgi:hypothetical protein